MACNVAQVLHGSSIADDGSRGELLLVLRHEGRRRPARVDGAIAAMRAPSSAVKLEEVRESRRRQPAERVGDERVHSGPLAEGICILALMGLYASAAGGM